MKADLSFVWGFNSEKLLTGEFSRSGVLLAALWRGSSTSLFFNPLMDGICLPSPYLIFTLYEALIYHLKWLSFPLMPHHVQISMSCYFCLMISSSQCLAVVPKLPHSKKPHWRDLCQIPFCSDHCHLSHSKWSTLSMFRKEPDSDQGREYYKTEGSFGRQGFRALIGEHRTSLTWVTALHCSVVQSHKGLHEAMSQSDSLKSYRRFDSFLGFLLLPLS